VVNCASVEYFKAIDRPLLNADVVTPQFKEMKNGKLKMISFFAKKARGLMARFIVNNRLTAPNDIKDFNLEGYKFDSKVSNEKNYIFSRKTV